AILNHQPVSPSQLNRAVPPPLEQIINRALEKDRNLRYQTAQDLRAELQRLKRAVELGPSLTSRPVSTKRTTGYNKLRLLAAGGALVGIVLLLTSILPPRTTGPIASYRITSDGRQKEPPGSFYPIVTDGARLYFTEVATGDLSFAQVSVTGGDVVS